MSNPYVVRPGETLSRIARRRQIGLDVLRGANPQLTNRTIVYPGEVLFIPEQPAGIYVVQQQDTWEELCARFDVLMSDLHATNPGELSARPPAGTTLSLPGCRARIVLDGYEYGYEELQHDIKKLRERYSFLKA